MPKANSARQPGGKVKSFGPPSKRLDLGTPKFNGLRKGVEGSNLSKGKSAARSAGLPTNVNFLAATSLPQSLEFDLEPTSIAGPSSFIAANPLDASLTTRDSSSRAFTRELRKVIDRSDVIIQVLDARDPEGTRSRWVEQEVRKHDASGKRLLGVVNKIDLVPRENLEAWLKHLRHYFPVLPFKSSTQAQRHNLSQMSVPMGGANPASSSAGKLPLNTTTASTAPIPTTSASLGAPALLRLLKQYALSRPHQTLTVGFIGYPNVGKSSLINSLKRSRACAVAAMPGKTRVVQEVVLDKGVKVLDCPGVVLEDFRESEGGGREGEEEKRRRLGEVMLRNCVKVEEIEDPIAPVEAILSRVEMTAMQRLYSIPPYATASEFLITIALTRGRLGKGGVPDLEAAAVTILRDWNAGKIPFHSKPPLIHPSAYDALKDRPSVSAIFGGEDSMAVDGVNPNAGSDAILQGLSEAFDLDGLLALTGSGEFVGEDGDELAGSDVRQDSIEVSQDVRIPARELAAVPPLAMTSSPHRTVTESLVRPSIVPSEMTNPAHLASTSRLFTADELAALPGPNPLDRKSLKQQAKKRAKQAKEIERQEKEADGDMFDAIAMFGGLTTAKPKVPERQKKKVKGKDAKKAAAVAKKGTIVPVTGELGEERAFASFLESMGADDDDMEP